MQTQTPTRAARFQSWSVYRHPDPAIPTRGGLAATFRTVGAWVNPLPGQAWRTRGEMHTPPVSGNQQRRVTVREEPIAFGYRMGVNRAHPFLSHQGRNQHHQGGFG